MEQPIINIAVTSTTHRSGKTLTTALIVEALEAFGFDDVVVTSKDGDFPDKMNALSKKAITVDSLTTKPQIRITDTN